jgi:hypothetical protein
MLSRLPRVNRIVSVLGRQGAAMFGQPAPVVAVRAAAAFSTDSSASPAAAAAGAAAESLHAAAYAELSTDSTIARDILSMPAAPKSLTGNDWSGRVYGPNMEPLVPIPEAYNPEYTAPLHNGVNTTVPLWSVRHLRNPDVTQEPSYTSVVPDLPATNRARSRLLSSRYNYKHSFSLVELSHNEFLKKLVMIESKLLEKFGSTAALRVMTRGRPLTKRFSTLRSPFVHKRAQDHTEYRAYEYQLQVSYSFELTDQTLNKYVFDTLRSVLVHMGTVTRSGYHIERRSSQEDKYARHQRAARAAVEAALAPKLAPARSDATAAATARISQSKNNFYQYVAEAERAIAEVEADERAAEIAETRAREAAGSMSAAQQAAARLADVQEGFEEAQAQLASTEDSGKFERRAERSAEREKEEKKAAAPKK